VEPRRGRPSKARGRGFPERLRKTTIFKTLFQDFDGERTKARTKAEITGLEKWRKGKVNNEMETGRESSQSFMTGGDDKEKSVG